VRLRRARSFRSQLQKVASLSCLRSQSRIVIAGNQRMPRPARLHPASFRLKDSPTMTPMQLPWLRTPLPYPGQQPGRYEKFSAERYAWLSSLPDDLAYHMWLTQQAPARDVTGVTGVRGVTGATLAPSCPQGKPPRAPLIQMSGWWSHEPPHEVRAAPWRGPGPCPANWSAAWALHVQRLSMRGRWELHQSGRWTYRQLR